MQATCEILEVYVEDACGAMATPFMLHRMLSTMECRAPGHRMELVLSPYMDAHLRCQLMQFTTDQLAAKGALIVNPFDRVEKVTVTEDLPKGELRIRFIDGHAYGVVRNLDDHIPNEGKEDIAATREAGIAATRKAIRDRLSAAGIARLLPTEVGPDMILPEELHSGPTGGKS